MISTEIVKYSLLMNNAVFVEELFECVRSFGELSSDEKLQKQHNRVFGEMIRLFFNSYIKAVHN